MINMSFIRVDSCGVVKGKQCCIFDIYVETSTDSIFITTKNSGITQMLDPETGLPLTYSVWQKKYGKE